MDHLYAEPGESDIVSAMRDMETYLDITPADARRLFLAAWRHAVARLRQSLTVEALMTRTPLTLAPDLPAPQAARLLADRAVSGAPVLDGDRLVGVVSVKDFLVRLGFAANAQPVALVAHLLGGDACRPSLVAGARVADIMTSPARVIAPEATASDAAGLMAAHAINRLPVMCGQRLVGIITRTDLARAFGRLTEAQP